MKINKTSSFEIDVNYYHLCERNILLIYRTYKYELFIRLEINNKGLRDGEISMDGDRFGGFSGISVDLPRGREPGKSSEIRGR